MWVQAPRFADERCHTSTDLHARVDSCLVRFSHAQYHIGHLYALRRSQTRKLISHVLSKPLVPVHKYVLLVLVLQYIIVLLVIES